MRITFDKQSQNLAQPDPYVIFANGKYYLYATGHHGVNCYVSDDLINGWRYVGEVFHVEGKKEYWAPCVLQYGGKFYMYCSCMSTDDIDAHGERLLVAESDTPDGDFTFCNFLAEPFSIDPHVVESGGKLFIFYSINEYEGERKGTYVVMQKMRSPFALEGEPIALIRPTMDEEISRRNADGTAWHTVEGAFYFREGDYHYVMYSGNAYASPYYYLGYAMAYGNEDDLTKLKFVKMPKDGSYAPVIAKNQSETSTGHNSVIKIDGKYYCMYHGRELTDDPKKENRTARVCELIVNNGKLTAVRS